jgi:hypothetical protein
MEGSTSGYLSPFLAGSSTSKYLDTDHLVSGVDQIQRATGKIRWRPFRTPYIEFTTYDTYPHSPTFILKAILDALKIKSMGRSDGKAIHYFGPLVDDDCKSYRGYDVTEKRVTNASDIGCRIVITESDKNSAFTIKNAIQYS